MAESVGIYIINENFVRIRRDDGSTTSIPANLYDAADYRPSLRFLPTADEYQAEHGDEA